MCMYWFGDCVCYWLNGVLQLFGCVDDQVKICGYCVELGEVVVVFGCLFGVGVVVVVVQEVGVDVWLVVYLVFIGVVCFGDVVLLVQLYMCLFVYMVLLVLVWMQQLLVIVNGKVDWCVLLFVSCQ